MLPEPELLSLLLKHCLGVFVAGTLALTPGSLKAMLTDLHKRPASTAAATTGERWLLGGARQPSAVRHWVTTQGRKGDGKLPGSGAALAISDE